MSHAVKIRVKEITRTDLSILVSDGRREAWVPLSQVIEETVATTGHTGIMTTTAIVVEDWVAKERGLEPSNDDDLTFDLFGGAA